MKSKQHYLPPQSKTLNLTHANLDTQVGVNRDVLFCWYYSNPHASTVLISTNGGAIPVKESVETINNLMKGNKNENTSNE